MANLNLNVLVLGGRITSDPELKQTTTGKSVTSFSIAINRGKDEPAEFFDVTAFEKTAETVARYFRKGSSIVVHGELRARNWEDSKGQKRKSVYALANRVYFVDSKQESDAPVYPALVPDMVEVDTTSDDGLPF